MTDTTTEEKLAAAQAAAQAKAESAAAAKAEKAAATLEAKTAKAAEKEAAKAATQAAKDARGSKGAEKEAAKVARLAAKEAKITAAGDAKAAKLATRQPEQNGIRRPGAAGLCGQVWTMADDMSAKMGQPVPVVDLLESGLSKGMNPSNVRTEYARWKKFHGLTGRIVKPELAAAAA